jgi:lipoprotein-anchoring transpeptidase ErfK/SrfK
MVVDKHENTLTVLADGQFFKKYGCRTGREDYMTPVGEFKITNKKKNPEWRKPGSGELIASGAPDNELGTRWMAFQGSSLGIHGTIDPSTIGYYASQGCVGMAKEDVEELFDYIPIGAPLTIKGEQDPARRLPSA